MLLKKSYINSFSILFLSEEYPQGIQAKEGFWASAQCFSFSTVLSLQRIDQLKTNAMQYPWYLWSTKGGTSEPQTVKPAPCRHPRAEDTFATSLHRERTRCVCGKRFIRISGSQVLPSIFTACITKLWHGKLASKGFCGLPCSACRAVVLGVS